MLVAQGGKLGHQLIAGNNPVIAFRGESFNLASVVFAGLRELLRKVLAGLQELLPALRRNGDFPGMSVTGAQQFAPGFLEFPSERVALPGQILKRGLMFGRGFVETRRDLVPLFFHAAPLALQLLSLLLLGLQGQRFDFLPVRFPQAGECLGQTIAFGLQFNPLRGGRFQFLPIALAGLGELLREAFPGFEEFLAIVAIPFQFPVVAFPGAQQFMRDLLRPAREFIALFRERLEALFLGFPGAIETLRQFVSLLPQRVTLPPQFFHRLPVLRPRLVEASFQFAALGHGLFVACR